MPLYMGIDAGGTKTDCAIGNGAALLGQATGETCKVALVREKRARHTLQDTILQTCKAANVSPREIEQVCIGISGASVPGNAAWAQNVIQEVVAGKVRVIGDHIVAHRAAFGDSPGVLVIAGTGSIAYGMNERGEIARAGGWGAIVSDQGSAFWIGREAVAEALRDYDLGRKHGIIATIAASWKVSAQEEVVRIANSGLLPRFAELAMPVAEAAEHGNEGAKAIIQRAGEELAALAGIVIVRLWPKGGVVRVAFSGGVLQGSDHVRQAFQHALRGAYPEATVSFAHVRPVLGALAIAAGELSAREAAQ